MSGYTIAVDVGVSGAVATMLGDELVELEDLPVLDGVISAPLFLDMIAGKIRRAIVIERIHAMPTGTKSNFVMGRNIGVILGVAGSLATPVVAIPPATWKRKMRLQKKAGKDAKTEARELAARLYPAHAQQFKRVKDHDRADAVLLGRAYSMMAVGGEL